MVATATQTIASRAISPPSENTIMNTRTSEYTPTLVSSAAKIADTVGSGV